MQQRLSVLIPLLLLVTTILTSGFMAVTTIKHSERAIADEIGLQINLDITRLQNILYNTITGKHANLESARLNISVTAMDTDVITLFLSDEQGKVILANRYSLEGTRAFDYDNFDATLAQAAVQRNRPQIIHSAKKQYTLLSYYPVILKLEGYGTRKQQHLGVLFMEYDYSDKVVKSRREAIINSATFAGITILSALVIAIILHLRITRRLQQLNIASAAIADGKFNQRAKIDGHDELANVGRSFNSMADKLQRDVERREEIEHELLMMNENLESSVAIRTEELREAQAIAHIGNWHWHESSGDLNWSAEIYHIFGLPSKTEMSYQKFIQMVHPDDVAVLEQAIESAFIGNGRYSVDHRIITSDGEEKWVHEEGVTRIDSETGERSIKGVVQDVTERKQHEVVLREAKEKAEEANRAKSHFLSRMSHELRTPMNAILGFSQVLATEGLEKEQQNYVVEIQSAGEYLLELIKELLDIGSIESGRLAMMISNEPLLPIIDDALKLTQGQSEAKSISIHNYCSEDISVIADQLRLQEVLVNILSNAIKYNHEHGVVEIRCSQLSAERLQIQIQDNGPGLTNEQLIRVFEPFERLGAEYSGVEGSGLGLYLSRQLMDAMDGSLSISSIPGTGSQVTIELPMGMKEEVATSTTIDGLSQQQAHGKRTVLYIEDNSANVRVVEAMLKRYQDLYVISTHTALGGIEMAHRYQPDMILLDINLPDMSGYEVLHQLKQAETTRHIPVAALTADAMPMEVQRGLEAGFERYLIKPVRIEELVDTINSLTH